MRKILNLNLNLLKKRCLDTKNLEKVQEQLQNIFTAASYEAMVVNEFRGLDFEFNPEGFDFSDTEYATLTGEEWMFNPPVPVATYLRISSVTRQFCSHTH